MLKLAKHLIFVSLVLGLLLIAGCSQYFGQEARGQQVTPTTVYGGEVYVQNIITGKCRLVSRSADYYQLEQAGYYTSTAEKCKGKMEGKQIQEISSDKLDLLQKLDVDDDGDIDNDDFFLFSNYFGTVKGGGANEADFFYDGNYDFNDDGRIDNDDFFILSEHFGRKFPKDAYTGPRGDYNRNKCIDAKSVDGVMVGEDGEAFMKYYTDGDKRADLDENGVVDLEDFLFFSEQAGKFGCGEKIEATCVDNDSGQSYFIKSTTTGLNDAGTESLTETDFCVDSGNVREYFCSDWYYATYGGPYVLPYRIMNADFTCPEDHECKEGACVSTIPVSPITGNVYLGENIVNVFGDVITARSGLIDLFKGSIFFDRHNYKTSEKLYLSKNKNITPQTSLTSSDDDYKENIVLEFEKGAMQYIYSFDDPIKIGNVSINNPLYIDFLGKRLRITSVESPNKIKGIRDVEYFLNKNTCASISSGKKMCLAQVGSNGDIVVHVGGVSGVIAAGKIQEIDGVKIVNEEQFYDSNPVGLSSAILVVKDEELVIQDADGYPGDDDLCSWEDYKDPDCWKFIVKNMDAFGATQVFNDAQKGIYYGANGPVLGLKNDFALNDDKDNPPGPGGCVRMPENYLGICFTGLNYQDEDAMDLKISRDTGFDSEASEAGVGIVNVTNSTIFISSSAANGLLINLAAKGFTSRQRGITGLIVSSKIWLNVYRGEAVGVYYEDTSGVTQLAGWVYKDSEAIFVNHGSLLGQGEDEERIGINLGYEGTRINLDVKPYLRYNKNPMESVSSFWALNSKKDVVGLGKTQSMEEAEELIWFSGASAVTLGTKDENHRTKAGIIVENPKANGASDAVRLKIPYGIVMADIAIKGRSQ